MSRKQRVTNWQLTALIIDTSLAETWATTWFRHVVCFNSVVDELTFISFSVNLSAAFFFMVEVIEICLRRLIKGRFCCQNVISTTFAQLSVAFMAKISCLARLQMFQDMLVTCFITCNHIVCSSQILAKPDSDNPKWRIEWGYINRHPQPSQTI